MSQRIPNDFRLGINLDLDETRLPENTAVFLKNVVMTVNSNPNTSAQAGSNKGVSTPIEGNAAITLSLASGTNYCIGTYSSEQTNELYSFIYNSSGNHSIWLIRGNTGALVKVYQGSNLNFQLNPIYFIKGDGRCTLELVSFFNKVTGLQDYYKMLCFTDNFNEPRCISVEDSIATGSFSTSFFTSTSANYIFDTLTTLGVPLPIKCLKLNNPTAYTPLTGDSLLQNNEIRIAWQFRIKNIDIFGRESEHGIISDVYMTVVGGGCLIGSNNLPRCVNLCFDAGNPLVNQIAIEYRMWVDGTTPIQTVWKVAETIDKYDNSGSNAWYNRSINPALVYDGTTNIITYTFCADGGNTPVPIEETNRTQNSIPRWSSSIGSIAKRLLLANNVRDFQPIDPAQLAKISVSAVTPGSGTIPCNLPPNRRVVVLVNIHRPFDNDNAIIRQSYGSVVFGNSDNGSGCMAVGSTPTHTSSFTLDQVFGDQKNPGFIGYLVGMTGTEYAIISRQVDFNPVTGTWTEVGYGPGISFAHTPMQLFEFTEVIAGEYVFRVASHKAKITDGDFQKTSTYVMGQSFIGDLIIGGSARYNYYNYPAKELMIFCTSGDVLLTGTGDKMLVIADLGNGVNSGGVDGYLYEEIGGLPVECNPIWLSYWGPGGTTSFGSCFTDHNGFYFGCSDAAPLIQIYSDFCDGSGSVFVREIRGNRSSMWHGDGTGTATAPGVGTLGAGCGGVTGYWGNRQYLKKSPDKYPPCARRQLVQDIFLCGTTDLGVPGVLCIWNFGQSGTTNSSGRVTLIAHNRYNYSASIGGKPLSIYASRIPAFPGSFWQDTLLISPSPSCPWFNCDTCVSNLGGYNFSYIACCDCITTPTCRTHTGDPYGVRMASMNQKGIQTGGLYPVGVVLHDGLGRHGYVQKVGSVQANNLNDAGYQKFALQAIGYVIGSTFTVPTYFKYLTFVVGENANFSAFMMWDADFVQFIDASGNTNTVNPTSIRIYYQSLIEYNKQYNYSTTSNWDFVADSATGMPVEGDVIQFICKGTTKSDGSNNWFDSVISSVVTYAANKSFITIDYDSKLKDLINGALFKVIRPRQYQSQKNTYYEQCLTIKLNSDGTVPGGSRTGTLNYWDSYILSRQIPVPLLEGQTAPIAPGGAPTAPIQYTSTSNPSVPEGPYNNNNAANNNNVVVMSSITAPTAFPFYFECSSASDLWGKDVANRGRVFFINPNEQQRRIGTEMALSATTEERGSYTGIGYFDIANSVVFDKNAFGDITIVLIEMGVCMVICDSDYFLTRYGQSQAQLDSTGNIMVQLSNGSVFTQPQQKIGKNNGCVAINLNTITKYEGLVTFLDSKGHFILSDFSDAKQADLAGYQGYLQVKMGLVNIRNLTPGSNGLTYWHSERDPQSGRVYLTMFNIPVSGSLVYLNPNSQPTPVANETFVFDIIGSPETPPGILRVIPSFTPEYFGRLPKYLQTPQFLSFKGGQPWKHHFNRTDIVAPPLYANFYGTQCECRITAVTNVEPETVKNFLYNEMYVKENISGGSGNPPTSLFLCDVITTEAKQLSRLLTPQWEIKDGFSCAAFLCDLNTPADPNIPVQTGANVIRDGNSLMGRWIKVSYVTQASYAGSYFELTSIITGVNKVPISGK